MYLSKLELNPRSHEARRDLAQPYELHRTLARAFPTPDGLDYRAAHGVLFRLEPPTVPDARPVVLVQSTSGPIWETLPTGYLHASACRELAPTLTPGLVLGFRLVANPTKKVMREGRRQGNRVPLFDTGADEELTPAHHWLRRKAELNGFEVLHVLSEGFHLATTRSSSASSHQAKQQLPLYGVRFDGLLRVHDPLLVAEAVRQGIGPAKSFGFGLLSLTRLVSS